MSRITSKAADPAPTMIPARSSVSGIPALRKVSAVNCLARKWSDCSCSGACNELRKMICLTGLSNSTSRTFIATWRS